MWLAGAVALLLFAWPSEAHAWGPVTHLVHGSEILASLSTLAPALQEILRAHRLPYLYGCIAADIVQAKKYTRSLYTHCHCWPVGWQLVESARGEREQAFAYGYLSHLAGEVDRFNAVCVGAIHDLLAHGHASACQQSDPTGRETLSRAESLRRKLRALRRRGRMTAALDAEVRALVA